MTTLMDEPLAVGDTAVRSAAGRHRRTLPPLLAACRPHQWVKNLLVYAVPFAAARIFDLSVLGAATGAAVAFTMAASATYLINDAGDAEADRLHPTKRYRPIAAGLISPGEARLVAAALLVAAVLFAAVVSPVVAGLIVVYLGTTTAYSRWLKQVPLLDAVLVAAGFVLRTAAGGAAAGLVLTPVFLAVAMAGSLFIVFGKRLGEVLLLGPAAPAHRRVLAWDTPQRCTQLLAGALAATVATFSLWELGAAEPGAPSAISSGSVSVASLAIIPFTAAALRAGHLIRQGRGGDPLELVTHDRVLPGLALVTLLVVSAAIYG